MLTVTRPFAHHHLAPTRRRAALALLAAGAVLAGCGTTQPSTAPTSTSTSSSPSTSASPGTTAPRSTTTPAPTTTTTVLPRALQPTPEDAADALISGWVARNRAVGLTVATAKAVATLFVRTAPTDLVSRQCTSTFMPIICTYGPPGGASAADPIYELSIVKVAKGWYVRSIDVEG